MRIAWCPQHRGVMRISFFDPPMSHFREPCPRCQGVLVEQVRNKYELNTPGASGVIPSEESIFPDEIVTPAPKPVCQCCCTMKTMSYCNWCKDCPTDHCTVPTKVLEKVRSSNGF